MAELAVSGTVLYWTETGPDGLRSSTLARRSAAGTVTRVPASGTSLAVDGDHVYFIGDHGAIVRRRHDAAERDVEVVSLSPAYPDQIAVGGGDVFAVEVTRAAASDAGPPHAIVWRIRPGGAPAKVIEEEAFYTLRVQGDRIYVGTAHNAISTDLQGADLRVHFAGPSAIGHVGDASVFVVAADSSGVISGMRAPKAGGRAPVAVSGRLVIGGDGDTIFAVPLPGETGAPYLVDPAGNHVPLPSEVAECDHAIAGADGVYLLGRERIIRLVR